MKKTLKIVFLAAVILGAAGLSSPRIIWDGGVTRSIKVTVRSEEGGLISGATVSLIQGMDDRIREVSSDEEYSKHLVKSKHRFESDNSGSGVLQGQFGAGGGSGVFGRTGNFIVRGNITVTHPNHDAISLPLANFTGDRRISINKKELEFTVFMHPKKTEQVGADQSATAPQLKSEGNENPKHESEARPR